MGHVNAGLEFLINVFNDMWPLVLATFIGAWVAFQHHQHKEKRKEIGKKISSIKHTLFVISSQTDRLKQIFQEHFVPHQDKQQRGLSIAPIIIHEEFPGLDMQLLPLAFDNKEFRLMNETTTSEQGFIEIVEMLKQRAARLSALALLDLETPNGKRRKHTLEQSINDITDRLYSEIQNCISNNLELLEKLNSYFEEQDTNQPGALVDYSAWYFLAAATAIAGVFFFSHWAINARSLVSSGLDITLVSAVVFAISLYASLAIGIIVAILSLFSLTKKLNSFSIYFWTFLISLQPVVFLLWLDVS